MFPRTVAVLLLLCLGPMEAEGQTLREDIQSLFVFGECGLPLCLDADADVHGRHFIHSTEEGQASLIEFLTQAIGLSIGNLPLTAASGGAMFTFEDGELVQTAVSAGPIFGDRAQTLGQGRMFLGMNVAGFRYNSLRGTALDDLLFRFTHEDDGGGTLGDPVFENDVLEVRTAVDLGLTAVTLSTTYGITDRLDVGLAIPVLTISMNGTSAAVIIPFDPETTLHTFITPDGPSLGSSTEVGGTRTGLGDVALRAKYNITHSPAFGFSVLGDLRLPTGDQDNLLGSGAVSARVVGVGSATVGLASPHLNLGYIYRSGESQNQGALAVVGLDFLATSWATLAFDLVSEWQIGESALELPVAVEIQQPTLRRIEPTNIPDRSDNLVYATFGVKAGRVETFNVVASAIVPMVAGGLQPRVAWNLGLEYNFWAMRGQP